MDEHKSFIELNTSDTSISHEIERFPMDADSVVEAIFYLSNRMTQMLSNHSISQKDVSVFKPKILPNTESVNPWGVSVSFQLDNANFHSIYVLKSHRGQGHFPKYCKTLSGSIATIPDCKLEAYLTKIQIPHQVIDFPQWPEYSMIFKFYGNKIARRTKLHLMNHIDEGIFILFQIGASELAARAYCIHPLLQGDPELSSFWDSHASKTVSIDPKVLILAMEYRKTANAHLSFNLPCSPSLSPLKDVNDMLIADKVQNRKDFERFHIFSHPRRQRLKEYFGEWLKKLGVSEENYQQLIKKIYSRTLQNQKLTDQ